MKIPSSHSRRQAPLQRSAPRDLAKTIARDETNMSTFECTRKLPQHACTSFILVNNFYLKHLYIFIEKGKKSFITIFKEITTFICFSKTSPFSDHSPSWSTFIQPPHTDPLV